ncbi:MAG: HPt (histidine-containing phosphotransfer) domain-containing protein [Sediminicola sp.]|jgi:HPt (histidine-containing phosphotransfer) domain-containing protein|uniref:hypothetical protein n=1 Tax=Nonlabens sp. TaxID=1888209 RepID=UPI0039E4DFF8|tara:strand:+ start:276 stop:638 length:363 start_codon:yes stop_codon:yes gene_type:complete
MNIQWNTTHINLKELIKISRGDRDISYKYLQQFKELIPKRTESLKKSLKSEDRKMVRQILHQMSPQLQFFGIKDITKSIRRLELEYETMPIAELTELVQNILVKLDFAIKDVNLILEENY